MRRKRYAGNLSQMDAPISHSELRNIASRFCLQGMPRSIVLLGRGHINDTFRCILTEETKSGYVLQRINKFVFNDPLKLMTNIGRVTRHLREKIKEANGNPDREALNLIPTAADGASYYKDTQGQYWRMFQYVDKTRTCSMREAPEAARAFGLFQKRLLDLSGGPLYETISGFHDTPKRLKTFEDVLKKDRHNRACRARPQIDCIERHTRTIDSFFGAVSQGRLLSRIVHNDAKPDNVLLDETNGKAICVIDLDTVMPGLSVFDFGDLARSCVSKSAEDERDLSKVNFDPETFAALAQGYCASAAPFLSGAEIEYLPAAARMITLEQGLRFLTDYLSGDVYYKISRKDQNLDRCRTQLKLVADMDERMDEMTGIIAKTTQNF